MMKRKKGALLVCLGLSIWLVTGCMNTTASDEDEGEETVTKYAPPMLEVENSKSEGEAISLFDIRLNKNEEMIELIQPNGEVAVLADEWPTEPTISGDQTKALYIAPLQFEVLGDVYVVDLITGEQEIVVSGNQEEQDIPKYVAWDPKTTDHFYMTYGLAYGTVAAGGNIYKVDTETGTKEALTEYENNIQVTGLKIQGNILYYFGIEYTDDILNDYVPYVNFIELEE
ncbi:DUF4652 domain-containing protein [Alkalihalobacillus pseudalcaliphilus]|uniref:DUF4652 domain-containing protein n=1 Tax=Alkalihalobacillus pseudalcaliphilus TaxID=79884 RepID=UPI000AC7AC61|nr:DUF4652 domain-containing protein [Alkalihalobacillus pseudalcaliphilus]